VVGSGIAAQRLSPHDVGLQLLENAAATGAGLVAVILAVGSVSGTHLNPAVSLAEWLLGGLPGRQASVYVVAQLGGGAVGCALANTTFAVPTTWATTSRAEGTIVKDAPEVLFVCVQNAGRSQMAATLLHHHARGRVRVRSAGSIPADQIHRNVVEAMAEVGLDVSRQCPRPLTDEAVRAADVVITMGCGDACPIYPGKRYLDWDIPDPAAKPVAEVAAIRDEIDRRVRELLDELVPPASPP
jgi:protein-tyrosine-phosphatase